MWAKTTKHGTRKQNDRVKLYRLTLEDQHSMDPSLAGRRLAAGLSC